MTATKQAAPSVSAGSQTRSLDRALAVLRCFGDEQTGLRPAEVARQLQLSTSTAHRLVRTLTDHGFLEPAGQAYQLGPAMLELGLISYRHRGLQHVGPELDHLMRVTGATADLAIRSNERALLVAGGSLANERVGGIRRPLHSTALGKVLLAWGRNGSPSRVAELAPLQPLTERTITDPERLAGELERVRAAGYAVNDRESAVGVRTVAVPILDRERIARFALAVRGTPDVLPASRIPKTVAQARSCARALSVLLIAPEQRWG